MLIILFYSHFIFIYDCYKLLIILICYAIFYLYKKIFFKTFCAFLYIILYTLNITKAIKMISVNEIRYLIFVIYYNGIGFSQESSHYSINSLKRGHFFIFAHSKFKFKFKSFLNGLWYEPETL